MTPASADTPPEPRVARRGPALAARPRRTGLDAVLGRRRLGAVTALAALSAVSACGVRVGSGSPAALPTPDAAQAARDALARQALLLGSAAGERAGAGGDDAARAATLAEDCTVQLEALGGVWQPWATAVPSTYPTATPLATAAPGTGAEDLVTLLAQSVALARGDAQAAPSADADLETALTVSWSAALSALSPGAVVATPRSVATMTKPLSAGLLALYDAARYAMEEIAARAGDEVRSRAMADAALAQDVVSASLALGGEDGRLAAYGAPTAADAGSSVDATWARRVWLDVMAGEVAAAPGAGGDERGAGIDAATDAALRAVAWGASVPALPGYDPAAVPSAAPSSAASETASAAPGGAAASSAAPSAAASPTP